MSAFARFSALRHLDLQLLGRDQVFRCNAETARRDLLDRRATIFCAALCRDPFGIFTALAAVALAAQSVHGDRKAFMCFLGDRTVGHRARLESLNDALGGLNLIDADAAVLRELEFERAPQSDVAVFPVDRVRKLLEQVIVTRPCRLPQKRDRLRVVEVIFLVGSLLVPADDTK